MQFKEVISAFILTKNSEKTIERTLKSIVPFVGNIIILDTGSTDKTVQCCLQYGCTVWYDSWKQDFSYSRNLAKAYCNTPWLLMIDSDEELQHFDTQTFLEYYANSNIGGFSTTIVNYLDEQNETFSKHTYTRLFRNHKDIQFEGSIHEQIAHSIVQAGYEIIDSQTTIAHYGYKENSEEKRRRNLTLLENEYEKSNNDYTAYQLLLTYFANQDMKMVLHFGNKLQNSSDVTIKQRELIRLRMAQAYLQQSDFNAMEIVLQKEMSDSEYEFFRKYLLVVLLMQRKKNFQSKNRVIIPTFKFSTRNGILTRCKEIGNDFTNGLRLLFFMVKKRSKIFERNFLEILLPMCPHKQHYFAIVALI
jgi:glycosyltransferase involved in cell wall biosynthesis